MLLLLLVYKALGGRTNYIYQKCLSLKLQKEMSSIDERSGLNSPSNRSINKKNAFNLPSNKSFISDLNTESLIKRAQRQKQANEHFSVVDDQTSLADQNRKLRRKLKQLSSRLDEELERAAQNKLKMQNMQKQFHPTKVDSQNLELQNAYKMIERLQKSVKDFENKESYQVSVKRIMDLESIIKKKEHENEELKTEIKLNKKTLYTKEKLITELLENSKKTTNLTEDKEVISKLKQKLKKLSEDNDTLRKKELSKHEQLVKAERKLVEIEQQDEIPVGREETLLEQLEQYKKKYKEAMMRVQKQNQYIIRLNEKLDREGGVYSGADSKVQRARSNKKSNGRSISTSLEDLPSLNKSKLKADSINYLEHLPSPKRPLKLKRY